MSDEPQTTDHTLLRARAPPAVDFLIGHLGQAIINDKQILLMMFNEHASQIQHAIIGSSFDRETILRNT